jgi:hypothetical protein
MKRLRSFDDSLVAYATVPSRRGFFRVAAQAVAVCFAGGAAVVVAPDAAAAGDECLVEYPPANLDNCPNKRHHPGHQATSNGCGPEGDVLNKIIPNGWGGADFKPSCDAHDICYGTCNTVKEVCDVQLADGASDACEAEFGGNLLYVTLLAQCKTVANAYGGAVYTGGAGAFEDAQREDCECCHPPLKDTVYCGYLDACYPTIDACMQECKNGLGTFGGYLCGTPPEGKCKN